MFDEALMKLKEAQQEYNSVEIEWNRIISVRDQLISKFNVKYGDNPTSLEAVNFREEVSESIKSVEKFLPHYSNAGVKWRKAQKRFMKIIMDNNEND